MLVVIKYVKHGQPVTELTNKTREKDRSVTLGPQPASGDWWKKAVVSLQQGGKHRLVLLV